VNHLLAHLHTVLLCAPEVEVPYVTLLVSGGHTILFLITAPGDAQVMGATLDDAAGEALDKAAHLLDLGYPGGPALDAIAAAGDPTAIAFPRPVAGRRGLDFSFSGLKTALAVHLQKHGDPSPGQATADLAASYLEAVVDVLVRKTVLAAQRAGVATVAVVGGVAANRRLREAMQQRCYSLDLRLIIPPLTLCTDNAAMVAALGELELRRGRVGTLQLDASASVEMPWWPEAGRDSCVIARADC
jgi:N6-L-threonylcarbamoyladenine synthase